MAIQPEAYERRASVRVKSRLPAQFKAGSAAGQTFTTDISEGGLFLITDEDPPLGSRAHVHLELGTAQPIRILGDVVRKASMPALGIAVRFESMTLDDRNRLGDWIVEEISTGSLTPPHPYSRKTARTALEEEIRAPLDPSPRKPVDSNPPVEVINPSPWATAAAATVLLARTLLYVGLPVLIILLIGLSVGKFIDSLQIGM